MDFELVSIENHPNAAVLTHESETVSFPLSDSDMLVIKALEETVIREQGVGVAAPQIGVPRKIIVVHISEKQAKVRADAEAIPLTTFINPSYTPMPDAKLIADWEGCMSVENTTGKVPRYDKIRYTAQRPDGTKIDDIATDFTARVLQHEIDHVEGKLILDRLTPDCLQGHPSDMMVKRYQELPAEKRVKYRLALSEILEKGQGRTSYTKHIAQALKTIEQMD